MLISEHFLFAGRELQLYSFTDNNGVVWMIGKPFAEILGYVRPNDAVRKYVREVNQRTREDVGYFGCKNHIKTRFINKIGMYELIMSSKASDAIDFQCWVTNEVIPSIKSPLEQLEVWRKKNPELLADSEKDNYGYIYVATTEQLKKDGLYKIRMTHDLDETMLQLNFGSPYDFFFEFTFKTNMFRELEMHLYETFHYKIFKREFFVLTTNDVDGIFKICKDFVKNKK